MSALKFVLGRIARLSVVCSALLVFYCFYQFMVNKAYYNVGCEEGSGTEKNGSREGLGSLHFKQP